MVLGGGDSCPTTFAVRASHARLQLPPLAIAGIERVIPIRKATIAEASASRIHRWNEKKCAWCTDNGLAHNHVTPDCAMLQNANAIDQWKVLFNHQLCDSCLLPGHHWRQCKNKAQDSCPNCGNSHHPNIGCRPQQRNPTYPDAS